jgi:hypothetical protein
VTAEPRTAYSARHPGPEDLILVVEISDTSIRTDLVIKARLYAREQIPEFWTLDVNARQLYIHREPANGVYNTITIHGENENVTVGARPGAPIAVADLLPPMDA